MGGGSQIRSTSVSETGGPGAKPGEAAILWNARTKVAWSSKSFQNPEASVITRGMKCRVWAVIAMCFLIPLCAVGDGGFIPQTAFEKVLIPDQRALIHFASGKETLVIDTAFKGSGTNFAWIIPVPSVPVIEPASKGLFSTLHLLFQPKIVHDVFGFFWLEIIIGAVIGYVTWRTRQGHSAIGALVIVGLIALLSSMLLPSLGYAPVSASGDRVQILARKQVGVYDTVTLKSSDGRAVMDWLRQNDFAVRTNFASAIRAYAEEGWYFVASRIRLGALMQDSANAHPLMLKFHTEQAVYPLRLTGIDNEPCRIELFVFGSGRAELPNFTVERCALPVYPDTNAPSAWRVRGLRIRQPLLRSIVDGSPVATKAVGTLDSKQMQKDAYISWVSPEIKQQTRYSEHGAAIVAANWAVPALVIGLLGMLVSSWAAETSSARAKTLRKVSFGFLIGAALVWGAVFLVLPKTRVVVSRMPGLRMQSLHRSVHSELLKQIGAAEQRDGRGKVHASWIRQQLAESAAFRKQLPGSLQTNLITGELWREEDSPGNCVIRQISNEVQYVWYDIEGYQNVLPLMSLSAPK